MIGYAFTEKGKMKMLDYIISEVKPKNGVMRPVHEEVLNCECYFLDIHKGERAVMKIRLGDCVHYETHTFHTSPVVDFYFSKDSKVFTIETANTIYTMNALKSAPFPFSKELIRE